MKERRGDIRIQLISEKARIIGVRSIPYDQILEMADISRDGIFFKTDKPLPPQEIVKVMLELPGELGVLELVGKVCRIVWKESKKRPTSVKGFAIQLYPLDFNTEKIWNAYRIYMRNKQIVVVSKRIIDEFFGPSKSPTRPLY
jgi:hypothetical protein